MESLGPSEKEDIQKVDLQLGDLIEEMNAGQRNDGRYFYIGQQLSLLAQSTHVPDNVKIRLQSALQELQTDSFSSLKVDKIMAAKREVDEALEGDKNLP